ncbi:9199_t:CDS:2, partial [Scutellospora calospora]
LKLRETNPNYEYQKTVNDFVSDPETHDAIIENWIEEYGKNIKDSLDKDNYFSEIHISDNPSLMENEIKRLNTVVKNHENRIQNLEEWVQSLEKDNTVVKNNLLQQKLLLNQLDFLLSS